VHQFKTYVYSLILAGDQVLLAQDHDDVEYMARKLKEEAELKIKITGF
jgi:hypothetical protein